MNIVEIRLKNKSQTTQQPLTFNFKPGSGRFKKFTFIHDKKSFDAIYKSLQHFFYNNFQDDLEWVSLRFTDDSGHLWFILKHHKEFYIERNKIKIESESKKNALEKFFTYHDETSSYTKKPFIGSKISLTDKDQVIIASDQNEGIQAEKSKISNQISEISKRYGLLSQGKPLEQHATVQICLELSPIFNELKFVQHELQKNTTHPSKDIVNPWLERDQLSHELEILKKIEDLLFEFKDGESVLQTLEENVCALEESMNFIFQKYKFKTEDIEKFAENFPCDELTNIHLSCIKLKRYEEILKNLEDFISQKIDFFDQEWQKKNKAYFEHLIKKTHDITAIFQKNHILPPNNRVLI